jgi:hypothetical protein
VPASVRRYASGRDLAHGRYGRARAGHRHQRLGARSRMRAARADARLEQRDSRLQPDSKCQTNFDLAQSLEHCLPWRGHRRLAADVLRFGKSTRTDIALTDRRAPGALHANPCSTDDEGACTHRKRRPTDQQLRCAPPAELARILWLTASRSPTSCAATSSASSRAASPSPAIRSAASAQRLGRVTHGPERCSGRRVGETVHVRAPEAPLIGWPVTIAAIEAGDP